MHRNKNIIIIFPLSVIAHRTRLVKLVSIASDLGLSISTWAWERKKGDFHKELPIDFNDRKVLLKGGGYNSKWIKLYYPLWMFSVFFQLILRRPKSPVYCLGFETAFPAFLASKVTTIKYIFDDADRFSMIVNLPSALNKGVKYLERKTSEGSIINIIPGYERYEFKNSKQTTLKNMPDSQALEKSKQVNIKRPNAKVIIYVNGWMGETRGLPIILELAKRSLTSKADIHFIAAGNAKDKSASAFIKLPNVTYLGSVENHEALAWYRASDFIFTYYDPVIEINRYAESNKWGDGLSLKVPVIVNDEVITANFLRENNACISVPYHDIDALQRALDKVLINIKHLDLMKKNISQIHAEIKYFDAGMKTILQKVYYEKAS